MKILFCSDGSSQAERAVLFGVQIAAACKAESTILGIVEKAGKEEALVESLQGAVNFFKEQDLNAEMITEVGDPVDEIVNQTEKTHYDLVVIGAVRRSQFFRLINTLWMSVSAYKIIESVEPPVLVVIGGRPALRRILLCTSANDKIDKAIKFTGKIAQDVKAVVDLFHVMPEAPAMYEELVRFEEDADRVLESNSKLGRTLRHQKELLEKFEVFGELRLRQGGVVPELLKELNRTEYDLVVSGSYPAKGTLRKYVMGDVAREIVNRAELPVLVIRTGQGKLGGFFDPLYRLFRGSKKKSEASDN
jgi:nucleotide-binding universal stress UspA family protein